ncbi:MAG: hypothetical protein OXI30_10435 [Chloroflexota bacterium]|nr:hypothetical protein [Chloroflexota bacterium]
MKTELPDFRRVKRAYAARLIHSALSNERGSALLELIEYDDRRFRAVFAASYFGTRTGQTSPSKSQWNTLKKKLKRRDRTIFIFREHGQLDEPAAGVAVRYYLDFGFMRY